MNQQSRDLERLRVFLRVPFQCLVPEAKECFRVDGGAKKFRETPDHLFREIGGGRARGRLGCQLPIDGYKATQRHQSFAGVFLTREPGGSEYEVSHQVRVTGRVRDCRQGLELKSVDRQRI